MTLSIGVAFSLYHSREACPRPHESGERESMIFCVSKYQHLSVAKKSILPEQFMPRSSDSRNRFS